MHWQKSLIFRIKGEVRGRSHLSPATSTTESLWPRAPAPPTHWGLHCFSCLLPDDWRKIFPIVCHLTNAVPSPILPPPGEGHSLPKLWSSNLHPSWREERNPLKKTPRPGEGKRSPEIIFLVNLFPERGEDKPGGRVLISQPRSRAGQEKNSGEFWVVQSWNPSKY